MAQSGYTPISLYYTITAAAVPTAGNLVAGELALNTNDGKLYYKNSSGVVTLLAGATAGPAGGSNTQVQFNSSGALAGSANLTFNGTTLTAAGFSGPISGVVTSTSITDSGLTSGRVTYASTGGLLADSAALTWDGTTLAATKFSGALNGTVGATTPSTGAFTTVSASGQVRVTGAVSTNATGLTFGYSGSSVSLVGAWGGGGATRGILSFYLADQAGASGNEYMRLSDTGLSAVGVVTFSNYGVGTATFNASGVISSISDETWKVKDGAPVDPDAMLNKLEPGYWYYNDKKKETFGKDRQLGFYAQNVNAAIGPEAAPEPETFTTKNTDGTETIATKPWGYYDRSVLAVTVMSLQKALATIESLTARITTLENK